MERTTLILAGHGGALRAERAPPDAADPLRDAVARLLRREARCWVALVLHLSRLQPPAPRPHHRRIARAVLNDAASRREGQVFALGNGDLALLFEAADAGTSLAMTLARLFAADGPEPDLLLSRWRLPQDAPELDAFLESVAPGVPSAVPEPEGELAAVASISGAVEPASVRDLLERQTGALLSLDGPSRVLPLFREVRFSLPALEARAAVSGHVTADPFLFRHLIAHLDQAMLTSVTEDLRRERSMLAWARTGRPLLHVNLTVPGILSAGFADLAAVAQEQGARVAVEVALPEACADADAFLRARERVRAAGFSLVLDEVSHHALVLMRPGALQPDLLKLDWSRQILDVGDRLDSALAALGAARIVLQRADTEEAVRWGLARGIRRFQGRHVDAMLAAGRIETCPHSHACTLRQCMERDLAAAPPGRAGCRNLALLDAGALRAPALA